MRMVAYFAPLQTAVLNLTVIMEDHRGQKNLDPINKVTADFIAFLVRYKTFQATHNVGLFPRDVARSAT